MAIAEVLYTGRRADRLRSHEEAREKSAKDLADEIKHGPDQWQSYDSPLLEQEIDDGVSFDVFFRATLPKGTSLREYVVRNLYDIGGNATAIEFGGPGSKLFSEFPRGFFERTLGVTLLDFRSEQHAAHDSLRNHTLIASDPEDVRKRLKEPDNQEVLGDLTNVKTTEAVKEWLNGRKVDLVIERMLGPLISVPKDPYYMAKFISEWYGFLSDKGMMFIEVPSFMDPLLGSWIDKVRSSSAGAIEVQAELRSHKYSSRFRLQKKPGAPDELPLLSPEEVRRAYREVSPPSGLLERILAWYGVKVPA